MCSDLTSIYNYLKHVAGRNGIEALRPYWTPAGVLCTFQRGNEKVSCILGDDCATSPDRLADKLAKTLARLLTDETKQAALRS